ncbi:MAG: DUF3237 family protein [Proteobacteria bacterium]|nr:DUF3237 family protein [Pseudomonadota bacterium]
MGKIPALTLAALAAASTLRAATRAESWPLTERDAPKLELVLQLVVTCSDPESPGGVGSGGGSKDGRRTEIWPIVGGAFQGKGIRGTVIAGGGDFPLTRPDGVEVVDALYRLRTDDGVTIIIHNRGLSYNGADADGWHYRLAPEFIAPKGKYDWLNRALFIATLSEVPASMRLAKGPHENDRLIQVYRVN